jgi:WD40 repeat protein
MAQSPGTFTPTGDLTGPRRSHTATLLTNGKVLIAGGSTTNLAALARAELYDPSTGTFAATGDMIAPRLYHTATLLPDGKVLIAGGESIVNADGALWSAELYDPATGTFKEAGNMTSARAGHTATLLNTGKVLIAGGFDSPPGGCCSFASAELYDPSTGTFSATGSLTFGTAWDIATLLGNGRVLMEAGFAGDEGVTELYDPGAGTFSLTGASGFRGLGATSATLLTNGKVLATLESSDDPADQAEVYDPSTGTSTATGKMTTRGYSTATLLPDGKVLIAGEDFPGATGRGRAELYDPVTGTFSTNGDMVTRSRQGHTATLLPDGTVLLSGGSNSSAVIASAEIYHPAVLFPSPVLFVVAGGAQGAILHGATQQVVSPNNPAVAGEALEIYGTGLIDGSVIPPQVAIGGRMAEVLFFGRAPGYVGLNQINVRVPNGIVPGPAVSLRLNYLNRPSNEVTIGVQ